MGVSGMTVESLEHGRYTVASDMVVKRPGWGGMGVSDLDTDYLKSLKTSPTSREILVNFSKL